jgi:arylsulfatase A-like enzyme
MARGITDNAPVHGGKGMLYEGGIRVPYIFRWPGKIPVGLVCDTPLNSVDLYPTLLEVAGATPPPNYPLDGVSYLKLLEFFEDGRLELYNLREDLGEKNNLAARMPDKVKELHAKLET